MPAHLILHAAAAALTAAMQTPGTAPSYGELSLSAGFTPDPQTVTVRAGGAIDAFDLGPECAGYISDAPGVALDYRAGALDLYLSATSAADTTLIVRTPAGTYLCNDDYGDTFNPGVEISDPETGRYEIWVGTYSAGVGYPEAQVSISETGFSGENPFIVPLDEDAPAEARLDLAAGFSNDPRSVRVSAGGRVDLFTTEPGCAGFADPEPDLQLDYEAGEFPLYVSMESDGDTTILVRTPGGEYLCDDDGAGQLNPGVTIREPETGRYLVWAGSFGDGDRESAELFVSEVGFAGTDASLDLQLPPVFGRSELTTPLSPDPVRITLTAGGPAPVQQSVAGNTFTVGVCTGYVTRAASHELDWRGGGPLFISAVSDADTTLVVNAPDGSWWCDDDSAGDFNPGLVFSDALDGIYDIYVGTYGVEAAEDAPDADLLISATGLGPKPSAASLSPDGEPVFGRLDLAPGFPAASGRLDVVSGGSVEVGRTELAWIDRGCTGFVESSPSARLSWAGAGGESLHVFVEGEGDTTLLVRRPDGEWLCNDDDYGLSAGLILSPAAAGDYAIYVGSYGEDGGGEATLVVSEAPRPLD